jgi:hypothetical protein
MTAIILDPIKDIFTDKIFNENQGTRLGDSDNYYYIAIGKSQQWNPTDNTDVAPTPIDTEREQRKFRYNMQAVKAVEAFSYVVPLEEWTFGSVYSAYNDNVVSQPDQSYYIKSSANNVYVCIRQGRNETTGSAVASQFQPDHTDTTLPVEDDGYVWKYLYTISVADNSNFVTSNFMPVKFVDSAAPTSPDFPQYSIQNAAVDGQIIGYQVISGGSGYNSSTTLTVVGDGSGASAHPIIGAGGSIVAVNAGDSAGVGTTGYPTLNAQLGSGYRKANVKISDEGSGAEVLPIFAPRNGLGADARVDLRSASLMFVIKPEGTVDGKWPVDNDYRQTALLRNIKDSANGTLFTETAGTALRKMTFVGEAITDLSWENDIQVIGTDSDALGWIDYFDDSATIWYHQDTETGFSDFTVSETVTIEGKSGSFEIKTLQEPDIDIFSGDILFINNDTQAQTRDADATEDIKIVIKL